MAMTDKDVDKLAGGRELQNADTVSWKSERLDPLRGGLFDKRITGGHGGNRWSHIKLHTPLPNPIMEEPIRKLLGLTENKFRDVLAGRDSYRGQSGPQAISNALQDINVDREIDRARTEIKGGRKTYRDAAVRRLGYLKAAKKLDIHPKDWLLSKVPVLPPVFRPVSLLAGSKTPLVADPNYLYKELFDANNSLRDLEGQIDDVSDERLNLYDAFKAVTGLGDPIQPALKQQKVRGILKHIMGHSPKFGTVQRKLLGSTVDLVGRSVITPNPELDMDQVGLPEDKAWTVYKPFIIRRLVKRGMPRVRALESFEQREKIAKGEMLEEMKVRPVIIDRAPVLHRYGVMAFWPQLTKSNSLQIPPLVTGGFGADFDGDQMNFHVPGTDKAVDEAIDKMLPSRNLLSASDFGVHYLPSQEYVSGLWAASARKDLKKPVRKFRTKADAMQAYKRGDIDIGQRIEVLEH
jgi:DNA-directed RNA polymerase subunit beta'